MFNMYIYTYTIVWRLRVYTYNHIQIHIYIYMSFFWPFAARQRVQLLLLHLHRHTPSRANWGTKIDESYNTANKITCPGNRACTWWNHEWLHPQQQLRESIDATKSYLLYKWRSNASGVQLQIDQWRLVQEPPQADSSGKHGTDRLLLNHATVPCSWSDVQPRSFTGIAGVGLFTHFLILRHRLAPPPISSESEYAVSFSTGSRSHSLCDGPEFEDCCFLVSSMEHRVGWVGACCDAHF